MLSSFSSKRILVIGREVGPIIHMLKEKIPNASFGAVDLLGNEETRLFADWKFSVEKQIPDKSILRPKQRSIIDLLFELTLVMLEDLEFDILIPTAPFQTKPQYLLLFSKQVKIPLMNSRSLSNTKSDFTFVSKVYNIFPEIPLSVIRFSNVSNNIGDNNRGIFISNKKTCFLSTRSDDSSEYSSDEQGFLLPISQIHCAFFISFPPQLNFIGFQTLSSPHDYPFISDKLERNALIPFDSRIGVSNDTAVSFLSQIISKLELTGLISIYFGLSDNNILPISCNVLPDENFDLWESRSSKSLIPYIISANYQSFSHQPSSNFAYKLPIYSSQTIRIPTLLKTITSQCNIAGSISHPNYPICCISGKNESLIEANRSFKRKKVEIHQILQQNIYD
ncbi:MAG: hypothetical protein ACXAC8_12345 [Candidatus Hodarchaeales archaeon]|jgi:hypothetical protein